MAVTSMPTVVESRTTLTPPGSPVRNQRYVVPSQALGAWSNNKQDLIAWWDPGMSPGQWKYITPTTGTILWVTDEATQIIWDGTKWGITGGAGSTSDTSQSVSSVSGSVSPSLTAGRYISLTLTETTTVTLPSGSANNKTEKLTFEITQNNVGSHAIHWSGPHTFPGGFPPQLTKKAGSMDVLEFTWNGLKWILTNQTMDIR